MTVSGQGIFFDGATTARHDVTAELAPQLLRVLGSDGAVLAEWPYDQLETLSAPYCSTAFASESPTDATSGSQ